MNSIRHFLLALQFFTRIPITGSLANWVGFTPELQARSMGYLPLVGFIVGICSATSFFVFHFFLPQISGSSWVSAFMAILTSIFLTGALHEDGLADLSDGLGGSITRERALEIMKDSRIGTYGSIALISSILGRIIFLAILSQINLWLSLFCIVSAHIISRFFILIVVRVLSYAGNIELSKSKALVNKSEPMVFFVGTCWTAALLIGLCLYGPFSVLIWGLLTATGALMLLIRILKKRLLGFNGDSLGAAQQIAELAFYLGILLAIPLS